MCAAVGVTQPTSASSETDERMMRIMMSPYFFRPLYSVRVKLSSLMKLHAKADHGFSGRAAIVYWVTIPVTCSTTPTAAVVASTVSIPIFARKIA